MTDDTNIFKVIQGGGTEPKNDKFKANDYQILDIDDEVFSAMGFAIFTSQHVAIMRDDGDGPAPVLIVPLGRVKAVKMIDEELDEAPF